MPTRQPLPLLWLLSDARNDAALEAALEALPEGSAFVFRHYHLGARQRRARFAALAELARRYSHPVVLSANAREAEEWGAQGVYGPADRLGPANGLLRLATAHDRADLHAAEAARADAVFLSPVFATASHPGARTLGVDGFHALAGSARIPAIALGGMTRARAEELGWPRWGAIGGLVPPNHA